MTPDSQRDRLPLRERVRINIDTARWLQEQSKRALRRTAELMAAMHRAQAQRSLRAIERKDAE
jgi:hypothetical protein